MNTNRIVLDLDDTLNKLTMPVLAHIGLDVDPNTLDDYPIEAGYDIVKAANILAGPRKNPWTVQTLWDCVPRSLWATVPVSDNCYWLIDQCEAMVGRKNILIATSPTKDPECLAGKLEWIHDHLPDWLWRQYSITPRKEWLADYGTLLIDDCPGNIEAFCKPRQDGMGGGKGFLVPRPWNNKDFSKSSWNFMDTLK